MTKMKNYASENWIVLDVIIKCKLRFLIVSIRRINSIRKGDNKYFIAILYRLNLCF